MITPFESKSQNKRKKMWPWMAVLALLLVISIVATVAALNLIDKKPVDAPVTPPTTPTNELPPDSPGETTPTVPSEPNDDQVITPDPEIPPVDDPEEPSVTVEDPQGDITVQIGENYQLPEDYKTFSVKDSNGGSVNVTKDGIVQFESVGTYVLYNGGKAVASIYAVDTEAPLFGYIWGEFSFDPSGAYAVKSGTSVRLDDIFKASDNSGSATVSYRVFELGAKQITLNDDHTFKCTLPNGYYLIEATAVDAAGNVGRITQRIDVLPDTDYVLAGELGAGFDMISIPAKNRQGETIPTGTFVKVTMDVQVINMTTNSILCSAMAPNNKQCIVIWDTEMPNFVNETTISFYTNVVHTQYMGEDVDGIALMLAAYNDPTYTFVQNGEFLTVDNVVIEPVEADAVFTGYNGEAAVIKQFPAVDSQGNAIPVGQMVSVTMDVKNLNVLSNSILMTPTGDNNTGDIAVSDSKLSELTEWTTVTFETTVVDTTYYGVHVQGIGLALHAYNDPTYLFTRNAETLLVRNMRVESLGDIEVIKPEAYASHIVHWLDTDLPVGTPVTVNFSAKVRGLSADAAPVLYKLMKEDGENAIGSAGSLGLIAGYETMQGWTDWTPITYTGVVLPNGVGLRLNPGKDPWVFYPGGDTVMLKDVTIEKAADYALSDYTGSGAAVLSLPAVDAQGNTIPSGKYVTVTMDVKTTNHMTNALVMAVTGDGNKGEIVISDNKLGEYDEWKTITFEAQVTDTTYFGTAINGVGIGFHAYNDPTYQFVGLDENLLIRNVSMVELGDVEVIKPEAYASHIVHWLDTDLPVGTPVTVSFNAKAKGLTANAAPVLYKLMKEDGENAIGSAGSLGLIAGYETMQGWTDWTLITYTGVVLPNGVGLRLNPGKDPWVFYPGGDTVMLKDVTIEKAADYALSDYTGSGAAVLSLPAVDAQGNTIPSGKYVTVTMDVKTTNHVTNALVMAVTGDGNTGYTIISDSELGGYGEWKTITFETMVTDTTYYGAAIQGVGIGFHAYNDPTYQFVGLDENLLIRNVSVALAADKALVSTYGTGMMIANFDAKMQNGDSIPAGSFVTVTVDVKTKNSATNAILMNVNGKNSSKIVVSDDELWGYTDWTTVSFNTIVLDGTTYYGEDVGGITLAYHAYNDPEYVFSSSGEMVLFRNMSIVVHDENTVYSFAAKPGTYANDQLRLPTLLPTGTDVFVSAKIKTHQCYDQTPTLYWIQADGLVHPVPVADNATLQSYTDWTTVEFSATVVDGNVCLGLYSAGEMFTVYPSVSFTNVSITPVHHLSSSNSGWSAATLEIPTDLSDGTVVTVSAKINTINAWDGSRPVLYTINEAGTAVDVLVADNTGLQNAAGKWVDVRFDAVVGVDGKLRLGLYPIDLEFANFVTVTFANVEITEIGDTLGVLARPNDWGQFLVLPSNLPVGTPVTVTALAKSSNLWDQSPSLYCNSSTSSAAPGWTLVKDNATLQSFNKWTPITFDGVICENGGVYLLLNPETGNPFTAWVKLDLANVEITEK